MSKKPSYKRHDLQSLNVKTIRDSHLPGKRTELAATEDGIDIAVYDGSASPWVLSSHYNIAVSRNKIGQSLLKHHQNGFRLEDPNLYETRFFVEYHRLQDPMLRQYFNSAPVRQRLENLGMVTKDDNAICTTKDFAEYLRYLDALRSLDITKTLKDEQEKQLNANLQKVVDDKIFGCKLTGIYRKKKHKNEGKQLNQKKLSKFASHGKMDLAAIERAKKLKGEKTDVIKQKNQTRSCQFDTNKQRFKQAEHKRKTEAREKLHKKVEGAKQRREVLKSEKPMNKSMNDMYSFNKQLLLKEERRQKNIKIFEKYEEERRENVKKHEKKIEKIRENAEIRRITYCQNIARGMRNKQTADMVVKKVKILSKRYLKTVDPDDFEEVSRRISTLTEPFIKDSVRIVSCILGNLKITVSSATLVSKLGSIMAQSAVIIPEIGRTKCVLLRKLAAEFIFKATTQIKNERARQIRGNWNRKYHKGIMSEDEGRQHGKRVSMDELTEIIGESSFSYDEFIGELKRVPDTASEKTYVLSKVIDMELEKLFDILTKIKLDFSDRLKTRDFVHLYDSQKFFIHKSIRRLTELVVVKLHHYWYFKRKDIEDWKKLNLNLFDLSFDAMDFLMSTPWNIDNFCNGVRNISKCICIEISHQLNKEHINEDELESSDIDCSSDSDG